MTEMNKILDELKSMLKKPQPEPQDWKQFFQDLRRCVEENKPFPPDALDLCQHYTTVREHLPMFFQDGFLATYQAYVLKRVANCAPSEQIALCLMVYLMCLDETLFWQCMEESGATFFQWIEDMIPLMSTHLRVAGLLISILWIPGANIARCPNPGHWFEKTKYFQHALQSLQCLFRQTPSYVRQCMANVSHIIAKILSICTWASMHEELSTPFWHGSKPLVLSILDFYQLLLQYLPEYHDEKMVPRMHYRKLLKGDERVAWMFPNGLKALLSCETEQEPPGAIALMLFTPLIVWSVYMIEPLYRLIESANTQSSVLTMMNYVLAVVVRYWAPNLYDSSKRLSRALDRIWHVHSLLLPCTKLLLDQEERKQTFAGVAKELALLHDQKQVPVSSFWFFPSKQQFQRIFQLQFQFVFDNYTFIHMYTHESPDTALENVLVDESSTWACRAHFAARSKAYQEALTYAQKAIEANTANPVPYYVLGCVAQVHAQCEIAVQNAYKAYVRLPTLQFFDFLQETSRVLMKQAESFMLSKKYAQARLLYDTMFACRSTLNSQSQTMVMLSLLQCMWKLKDFAKAYEFTQHNASVVPITFQVKAFFYLAKEDSSRLEEFQAFYQQHEKESVPELRKQIGELFRSPKPMATVAPAVVVVAAPTSSVVEQMRLQRMQEQKERSKQVTVEEQEHKCAYAACKHTEHKTYALFQCCKEVRMHYPYCYRASKQHPWTCSSCGDALVSIVLESLEEVSKKPKVKKVRKENSIFKLPAHVSCTQTCMAWHKQTQVRAFVGDMVCLSNLEGSPVGMIVYCLANNVAVVLGDSMRLFQDSHLELVEQARNERQEAILELCRASDLPIDMPTHPLHQVLQIEGLEFVSQQVQEEVYGYTSTRTPLPLSYGCAVQFWLKQKMHQGVVEMVTPTHVHVRVGSKIYLLSLCTIFELQ